MTDIDPAGRVDGVDGVDGVDRVDGEHAVRTADEAARVAAVDRVDAVLPQTQCTRCGYPDCRSYASAIVVDAAPINRCPPGGAEGVTLLSRVTGRAPLALDPVHGVEGPLRLAVIDETWCIGCTLCLKACPVDCIVGGPKAMHTVIDAVCTGCELCIPACPVDCISLLDVSAGSTGWSAWSQPRADEARERHAVHRRRLEANALAASVRLAEKSAARLNRPTG